MTVFRVDLMCDRISSATWKKYFSTPMFGAGSVTRPLATYAPGAHMKYPPCVWMLIANLIFGNVAVTHCSFLISGSETSDGPANVSPVHDGSAPGKPSKSEPTGLLRLRSTPQLNFEPAPPPEAVIAQ